MANGNLKISLIFPDKEYVRYMDEVTSTVSLENKEIEQTGLFSTDIFGPLGTEDRFTTFAYIDLTLNVLHPRIYRYLCKIQSLYDKILHGKIYAIFNSKTKDFEVSNEEEGETGYTFFMKHLFELEIPKKDSNESENMRVTINIYKEKGTLTNNKLLVIPAGMRDINIEDDGRVTEDEMNEYYKKIISSAQMVKTERKMTSIINYLIIDLQDKINDLYDFNMSILSGKDGLIGNHVSSRSIDYSTRNVITGKSYPIEDLSLELDKDTMNFSTMGLYQFVKAAEPMVKYQIKEIFIKHIFDAALQTAKLYNPKTKRIEVVSLDNTDIDRWTSSKGLTNIFNRVRDNEVKNIPITVNDYILIPVYDNGDTIELFLDDGRIDDKIRSKIRGLTYGEFLYIASIDKSKETIASTVRYPITGQYSTYLTKISLSSTNKTRVVNVNINYADEITETKEIDQYPVIGVSYDDSFSISYTRLKGAGADFDGDSLRTTILFMKESIEEAKDFLKSIKNVMDPVGKLGVEIVDYICDIVIKTMTKR